MQIFDRLPVQNWRVIHPLLRESPNRDFTGCIRLWVLAMHEPKTAKKKNEHLPDVLSKNFVNTQSFKDLNAVFVKGSIDEESAVHGPEMPFIFPTHTKHLQGQLTLKKESSTCPESDHVGLFY